MANLFMIKNNIFLLLKGLYKTSCSGQQPLPVSHTLVLDSIGLEACKGGASDLGVSVKVLARN